VRLVSLVAACRISDREIAGSNLDWAIPGNDSGQVVHTHVPLSPSSISWYRATMRTVLIISA